MSYRKTFPHFRTIYSRFFSRKEILFFLPATNRCRHRQKEATPYGVASSIIRNRVLPQLAHNALLSVDKIYASRQTDHLAPGKSPGSIAGTVHMNNRVVNLFVAE